MLGDNVIGRENRSNITELTCKHILIVHLTLSRCIEPQSHFFSDPPQCNLSHGRNNGQNETASNDSALSAYF